ncbi:UTP14 [Lepeophtheirus salmonis]|uniref:UTP14 n=1 Tax=Lepeophtheirus salmonis TaxID=72036 RepID=A0A7R8H504_LEPSM|nr:UTP14 [Lepeophtheirus salmonis]CAF2859460.1 UTP14 [Lepeophtheirus salmonis]
MASLEGSKRFLHQTQADGEEEEDNFNYGVSQTSIDSLLGAVTDKKTKKSIRKSFSDQDKVDRKATYQRTQEELAQWDAVVHSRRNALSLNFPLVKPDLKLITSASHYQSKFEAKTPLEAEVMSLLNGSKTRANEAQVPLQSYQEQKVRRQNKIKSKKYRKILRKEKQKDKVRELELLHASNPELAGGKARRNGKNSDSRESHPQTSKCFQSIFRLKPSDRKVTRKVEKLYKNNCSSDNPWIKSNVPADKNKDVNEEGETFDEFSANYKEYWTTLNEQKGERRKSLMWEIWKLSKKLMELNQRSKQWECLDEDEEEGIRKVIAEAFADDDVIEKDFKADKKKCHH